MDIVRDKIAQKIWEVYQRLIQAANPGEELDESIDE